MTDASSHYEEMKNFMGAKVGMFGVEDREFQRVDNASDCVNDTSGKVIKVFRKIDHMMIFILIAGSYTPVCMIVLGGKSGYTLLAIVWGIAAVGIGIKAFWITCPKWFSSIIYIAMGWVCIGVFGPLWHTLPASAFLWLLTGGIIYTIPRVEEKAAMRRKGSAAGRGG